jgi:hypothetical protein
MEAAKNEVFHRESKNADNIFSYKVTDLWFAQIDAARRALQNDIRFIICIESRCDGNRF